MKKHAKKIVVLLLAVAMIIPTIAMIGSSAISLTYNVELNFENLFSFTEWASNSNSTKVVGGSAQGVGTLDLNVADGSFTLERTSDDANITQVYTGHGMDKENAIANMDYYKVDVEPNTTYSLSYNFGSSSSIDPKNFFITLFMFDADNLCLAWGGTVPKSAGDNSFIFTTPANTTMLQMRFGLDSKALVSAEISKISLNKCDVDADSANLFEFDSWANARNGTTSGASGTAVADTNEDSILMTANANSLLFTSFDLATINGFYKIPAAANTSYVLNYNLVNSMNTDFETFTPYVVKVSESGVISYAEGMGASGYGAGSCVFTTDSDTEYIYPVFSARAGADDLWVVKVTDIKLSAATIDENKHDTHRLVKKYGEDETYGDLPTPSNIPDGYVFAGWCTSEDGSGEVITANTPVQPMSLTVYPKFDLEVDTLTVKSGPDKKIYTAGEKLDTTGLVLEATVTKTVTTETDTNENGTIEDNEITTETITSTIEISSGYSINPEYAQAAAGTQTIAVSYGNQSTSFNITVKDSDPGTVIINGVSTEVPVANNEYTFNLTGLSFNRYEVTYKSDSYVSGVATFNDGKTEEFFLEPSENGSFASYIDKFLEDNKYTEVVSIKFTTLDKEFGSFELISLNTLSLADPGDTVYFNGDKFEMGIALNSGGAVSELYDVSDDIYARTYSTTYNDGYGTTETVNQTKVDYKEKLAGGHNGESTKVNLINTLDKGRYLQQSYYGSGEHPYVQSEYNNAAWPYNPVQGGNVVKEGSKIIDYKITDTYVYVKARPLDWAKWSDDYVDEEGREIYDNISWGDDYITDTYVEAWYYFQGGTIKVVNRKVDYSGLADAVHSQEFPALYLIEPLNHFVYNNVSEEDAWSAESGSLSQQNIAYARGTSWSVKHEDGKLINMEEPEYWGLTQEYIDKFNMDGFKPYVNCNENWAAFTASADPESFGVGIYTDVTDRFYYGVQPAEHNMVEGDYEGSVGGILESYAYRHAQTTEPSPELPTSYIAPTGSMTFRSYEPTEFTYYLATGTASEIRNEFKEIADGTAAAESGKPKIAVPETVYLDPANNRKGQYYVNNVMNANNYYNIETTTEKDYMYLGFHIEGADKFSVNITNIDEPENDIYVGYRADNGTEFDGTGLIFDFDNENLNDDTVIYYDNPDPGSQLGMHFSGEGLEPGEKATARWDITVTYENGDTEVFTAYTVMYAPHRTVGAVAEARQVKNSQHELSSWITGANGVDHSTWSPLGSLHGDYKGAGYFTKDPLYYENPPTGGSGGTATDYIEEQITGVDVDNNVYNENNYVMQTATNDHDSSRARSYLGLLAIDKSRYTNTDQIPNLKIGWDALRIDDGYVNNSLGVYKTYYTVGTDTAYTATSLSEAPSGWTQNSSHTDIAGDGGKSLPYRETLVPSYTVSSLDGKYLHAIAQGEADQFINSNQFATAGTSVLIDVTDKSALRDSVTDAYGVTDPSEEFLEKLEEAATILGTPGASQEDIDRVNDALNEDLEELLNKVYALKYDNLFSAYEYSLKSGSMTANRTNASVEYLKDINGISVISNNVDNNDVSVGNGNNPDIYYNIDVKGSTEYVFEYDVKSTGRSQLHLFFFDTDSSTPQNWLAPTNRTYTWTPEGGATQNHTQSSHNFANVYANGNGHVVMRFTTPANADRISFRFGNSDSPTMTSTFSNIRLVDSAHYYEDAVYSATETKHKEYTSYGALQIPTRLGYAFDGWFYADETAVTGSDVAVDHESIYSKWSIINYTITYNANGGSVSPTSQDYTVIDTVTLPTPTRSGYIFRGWKVTAASGSWTEDGICPAGEIPATMHGNAVLTAQWQSEYALKYDNLFSALEFSQKSGNMKANVPNATVEYADATITVTAKETSTTDVYTTYNSNDTSHYNIPLEANKEYVYEFDVDSDNGAQAFLFFYNENGDNNAYPTNRTIKVDTGTPYGTENSFPHIGVYPAAGTHHYVIRFTTPENIAKVGFRFGTINTSTNEATFSNIRLIDAEHYYEDVTYEMFEDTYKESDFYDTLQTPDRPGYKFMGWNTKADGSGDTLTASTVVTGHLTVYSQWVLGEIPVYFDTILDFDSWNTKYPNRASISAVTANGFTLTSDATMTDKNGNTVSNSEGTSSSPYFAVEPGKSYKVDIDITGDNWDVYFFFCDADGNWVGFDDSTNRFASNGHGPADRVFTAPDNTDVVKAQIRVDANGASNSVTFSDIRVYEAGTRAANVDVPDANMKFDYGTTFTNLPVPTREGYAFLGWFDEGDTQVTDGATVNYTSAVYLKSKWEITNDALVKDKVVIDFSTPIAINPLDNDTAYAKAKAASFLGISANGTDPGATTINGTYGKFTVSGETVTYTPTKTVDGVEKIYYHASITDENGEHGIKNEITVAPASNVLYEDTFFESTDLAGLQGIAWTDIKPTGLSTSNTANQTSSPIDDEKYGYDSNTAGYNQSVNYSNGTAKTVKVSADTSKMMSKNLTFTFSGTGFDLNSACGANTGVMIVSVRQNNADGTTTMKKSYVVDTYYGDANYGLASSSNTLYQVPIISESELGGYGNYTVQVVASYLPSMSGAISADKAKEAEEQQKLQQASVNGLEATIASGADNEALRNALAELGLDYIFDAEEVEVVWFDDNSVLNGGMGADTPVASDKLETAALDGLVNVIDSVRVYNPLNGNNDYYIASEKNAVYYNVINNLLKTDGSSLTNSSFFAYITGKLGEDEEGNAIQLTVSNYESVGPKNELYLSESTQAVAFKVNDFSTVNSAGGRVMISLRAASGTPYLKIGGTEFSVNSNTEMYYDITDYISEDGTVTIQNSTKVDGEKSLLAIGSLKVTCHVSMQAASISSDVDLETVRMMMMAPSVTVEPNTTPTPEEPEVPEEPEDPSEPEIPEEPEEPAEESWLIRIFKWIFNTVIKIFSALKGFLAI